MSKDLARRYLVPFHERFRIDRAPTTPPRGAPGERDCERLLAERIEELDELQGLLYADGRWAVLAIFQAMDAAGKDGTIRAVFEGLDPAGTRVASFKAPSTEELDHDFLWRVTKALPGRGQVGIFNRSHYEEVLIVRVHPELLAAQHLPGGADHEKLWTSRFESIREWERHLARSGTAVVKFFLNVSKKEQARRFIARLEEPEKSWKFSAADVEKRRDWPAYMRAYEEALTATSRSWAPWHAIPADDKDWMRLCVAEVLIATMRRLDLELPTVPLAERRRRAEMLRALKSGKA